ncbi:uncharacterized protein LOC120906679 isoform X1 [Anopheles arabiensis]|uniref:MATH domain-containing protein n=2 Tax=Anopheles arabiensis TaxID=7173 RepID=A0A182IAW4_ANOAR|nr:uncharacterized protein LOC120906679 isoform X1 [Anopheles arabiensis]XP_040174467.1 uncharacterized protein LOC120906679 isoform X1 [Anopheles arabiensis]
MATGTTTNGRLMFTQTSCYLCSEWLDDSDVEIHLRKCRRQQTVCPNRCGAIVAKKDLQLHSNTCPKSYGMESSNETSNEYVTPPNEEQAGEELTVEQVLQTLENDISSIQLLQTAQKEKHTDVQSELAHLKNYYDVSHRWTGKVYESIVAMYKMCYQDKMQHSLDISGLREQLKGTNEWRTGIINRIDALEKTLFFIKQDRAAIEQEAAVSSLTEQAAALSMGPDDGQQPSTSKACQPLALSELNNAPYRTLPAGSCDSTSSSSSMEPVVEVKGPIKEILDDIHKYQVKLNYNQKDIMIRLFECEERMVELENTLKKCRRETYHTKQRTEELQTNMLMANNRGTPASENGHVMWRIDNFANRLQQSKELETMMKGPIFTNHPYGYMLQLEASLYGIGTWRGRNLIAGLTILPGPYDELLEWPCRLSATICVRDQAANQAEAVPIYKPIVAKVKGQRDKNQHYVYVPHDQLYSRGYVKKDTLFLEVFVGEEGSGSSEL